MKKIITYLFVLLYITEYAQNNNLVQNAKWHNSTYAKYSGSNCYYKRNFNQYFNGDTIINSNQYFKLYETGIHTDLPGGSSGTCPNSQYTYTQNTNILVRYFQKKILIWSTTTQQDLVFLDYNLNVGDTIMNVGFSKPYGGSIKIPITNIDSVLINGSYLKRLHYAGAMGTKYIIEKIGSIQGFVLPYSYDFESGSELICYSENSTVLYNEPSSLMSCDITLGLEEVKLDSESVSIFPNPTSNEFNISFKYDVQLNKVNIKNFIGQVVMVFQQTKSLNSYDISSLKNGMYFVELETKTGTVSKKIVKQ